MLITSKRPGSRRLRTPTLAVAIFVALGVSACGDDTTPKPHLDLGNLLHDLPPNACSGCSGCCSKGQCLPGTVISACGAAGLTCRTCNPTDRCINGACVPPQPSCNPTTCSDGCCTTQGSCVRPPTAATCGISGATCVACQKDEVCSTAGRCAPPLSKTYSVIINSCTIDEAVKSCDNLGTCEAYAEVGLGSQPPSTTPIDKKNGATPVWNFKLFEATDQDLLNTKLKVTIYDSDVWPNGDDTMGTCEIAATAQALKDGALVTACGAGVKDLKLTFKLVP